MSRIKEQMEGWRYNNNDNYLDEAYHQKMWEYQELNEQTDKRIRYLLGLRLEHKKLKEALKRGIEKFRDGLSFTPQGNRD